jgi:hypothetical protein
MVITMPAAEVVVQIIIISLLLVPVVWVEAEAALETLLQAHSRLLPVT